MFLSLSLSLEMAAFLKYESPVMYIRKMEGNGQTLRNADLTGPASRD